MCLGEHAVGGEDLPAVHVTRPVRAIVAVGDVVPVGVRQSERGTGARVGSGVTQAIELDLIGRRVTEDDGSLLGGIRGAAGQQVVGALVEGRGLEPELDGELVAKPECRTILDEREIIHAIELQSVPRPVGSRHLSGQAGTHEHQSQCSAATQSRFQQ